MVEKEEKAHQAFHQKGQHFQLVPRHTAIVHGKKGKNQHIERSQLLIKTKSNVLYYKSLAQFLKKFTLMLGFCSLKYLPEPVIVPPVPIPETRASTFPFEPFQISGPVVSQCIYIMVVFELAISASEKVNLAWEEEYLWVSRVFKLLKNIGVRCFAPYLFGLRNCTFHPFCRVSKHQLSTESTQNNSSLKTH